MHPVCTPVQQNVIWDAWSPEAVMLWQEWGVGLGARRHRQHGGAAQATAGQALPAGGLGDSCLGGCLVCCCLAGPGVPSNIALLLSRCA